MVHHCHWPGCNKEVPPRLWGCREHWFTLPQILRSAIWSHYRPGQEIDKNPSKEYLNVADRVQKWCREYEQKKNAQQERDDSIIQDKSSS